ncbi:MAG: hypothetical protein ACRDP6_47270 [Actinoallomurus sp.]
MSKRDRVNDAAARRIDAIHRQQREAREAAERARRQQEQQRRDRKGK